MYVEGKMGGKTLKILFDWLPSEGEVLLPAGSCVCCVKVSRLRTKSEKNPFEKRDKNSAMQET